VNCGVIIQARTGSERLPDKVLRPILGRPLLELLVERAARASSVDQVVVATTTQPADDRIAVLCDALDIGCHRGSEDDVLARVLGAAEGFGIDLIVQLTGDNPLVDHRLIDAAVARYGQGDVDYVSNIQRPTYPVGINAQVYATRTLAQVAELTDDRADHEHVSLYLYEDPTRFRLAAVESPHDHRHADVRLTVDEPSDLALVTAIFERLYPLDPDFGTDAVVALLDAEPGLRALNADVAQRPAR
jgi:spore coat polysaccharide biosynthesis protein SpsF